MEGETIPVAFIRDTLQQRIDKILEEIKDAVEALDRMKKEELNHSAASVRIEIMRHYSQIENIVDIAGTIGVGRNNFVLPDDLQVL